MVWGNMRKGDRVIRVDVRGSAHEAVVASAGRKWITLESPEGRWHADTGKCSFGSQLHTEKTYAEAEQKRAEWTRRTLLVKRIRDFVSVHVPLEKLEAIAQLCETDDTTS